MSKNSMFKVTQKEENGAESFGLLPINAECHFLECRFSMEHKILTIFSKTPITKYQMIPKLDSNGNVKPSKVNKEGVCFERIEVRGFYDYVVTERKDIEELVGYLDSTATAESLAKYFIPVPEQKPTIPVTIPDGIKLEVASKDGK